MGMFEEVKADMLDRAKNTGACKDGYKMGMDAQSKADLLKAVTANWRWVLQSSKMIDASYLEENFTEEELIAAGIYTRKEHSVSEIAFACGSAKVKACGSATVKACDSATVKAYDSATVEAYDSATVEAYGSATVEAYGSATVKARESATVKAYDSATIKACDSATVEAYDSATVEACDYSYVDDYTGDIRPQSRHAIVKDYYKDKIYIKKGSFEIIEI